MHHGIPDSKVHGANMGPIWGRQDPGGPMLVSWTLLSRISLVNQSLNEQNDHYFVADTVKNILIQISLQFASIGPINWQQVSIGLGNGLVPNSSKSLTEPMVTQLHVTLMYHLGPLLLTWFNFNPSMDK